MLHFLTPLHQKKNSTKYLFVKKKKKKPENMYTFLNSFIYNVNSVRHSLYRRYRYLAHRSFVSWCWGYLARNIRVVLPSCVVLRIQQEFPDADGQFVGFRPPLD